MDYKPMQATVDSHWLMGAERSMWSRPHTTEHAQLEGHQLSVGPVPRLG